MKRNILMALAAIVAVACTQKEHYAPEQQETKIISINAGLSENGLSKVALEQGESTIKLTWEEGDQIAVSNGVDTEIYSLTSGAGTTSAVFSGKVVEGSTFSVTYPASVSEVISAQVQDGNASTAHLEFAARIEGLTDYSEFSFDAQSQRRGVIKFVIEVPEGLNPAAVELTAGETTFASLAFTNVVLEDDRKLTGYAMSPWTDVELAAGEKLIIKITGDDGKKAFKSQVFGQKVVFAAGEVSVIELKATGWKSAILNGSGIESDPYIISTADELRAINEYLISDSTLYFKQIADIDLDNVNWTPFNYANPYNKGIVYNGGNKKILNFSSKNKTYAGFAGVLYGELYDLTFENVTIEHNSNCGVIGGYIGTSGKPGYLHNVIVKNAKVTQGGNVNDVAVGTLASHMREARIEDCVVEAELVNNAQSVKENYYRNATGGIVGKMNTATDIIKNVTFKGKVTSANKEKYTAGIVGWQVSAGSTIEGCNVEADIVAGNERVGGIVGHYQGGTVLNCSFKGTITASVNNVGGILGYTDTAGSIVKGCSVLEGSTISGGKYTGGMVGLLNKANTGVNIEDCHVNAAISSSSERAGGIIGHFAGGIIKNCSVAGSVKATTNYAAGIAGVINGASQVLNSTVNATITGVQNIGGISGQAENTLTVDKCSVAGLVEASTGSTVGGILAATCTDKASVITRCAVSAAVKGQGGNDVGGIVGQFRKCNGSIIENCYVSGEVTSVTGNKSGQRTGGIVGDCLQSCKIRNCYVSGDVSGWCGVGGIAGRAGGGDWTWNADHGNEISKCIAWSGTITATRKDADGGSSGAIVGFTGIKNTLSDCVRRSDLTFNGTWTDKGLLCDQENAYSSNPLSYQTYEGFNYIYPYHGKAATNGETCSDVARRLGWSESIWNLSGSVPVLK